jgi:hypothetical protein
VKKYAVVLFDSTSSGVVPCTWIFTKSEDGKTGTYCYYPPESWTDSQLNRAISACSDPDKSWKKYGCRHLYSTGFCFSLSCVTAYCESVATEKK